MPGRPNREDFDYWYDYDRDVKMEDQESEVKVEKVFDTIHNEWVSQEVITPVGILKYPAEEFDGEYEFYEVRTKQGPTILVGKHHIPVFMATVYVMNESDSKYRNRQYTGPVAQKVLDWAEDLYKQALEASKK